MYLHDYLIFSFKDFKNDEFIELLKLEIHKSKNEELINLFRRIE